MAAGSSLGQKILKPSEFERKMIGKIIASDIRCTICLDIFKKPYGLDCKHVFCQKCLVDWRTKNNKCPMCRNPISKVPIKCEWLASIIEELKEHPSSTKNPRHRTSSSNSEHVPRTSGFSR